MDFEAEFNSDSVKRQARAALLFGGQGKAGAAVVGHLLAAMARVLDLAAPDYFEERLLAIGLTSAARVVAAAGYDDSNPVHRQLWEWIVSSVASQHDIVAASAIYSLGVLRRAEGVRVLREVIESPPRLESPPMPMTLRGTAFQALMTISREEVTPFIGSPACSEYLQWVENRLADMRERQASQERNAWQDRIDEQIEECAWLRN